MDKQPEQHQNKVFIGNMVESAIRIGLLLVLLMFTYDIIRPFIIPVIWGAIIAVALMPLTLRIQRWYGNRRGLAATTVALLGIVLLVTPLVMISVSVYHASIQILETLQQGQVTLPGPDSRIADIPVIGDKLFDMWSMLASNLEKAIQTFLPEIKSALSALIGVLGGALGDMLIFILSLAIAAGFMTYSEKITASLKTIAVRAAGTNARHWTSLIAATIKSVLLGVVGVAAIQALLIGAGFFVFGVPAAGLLTLLLIILCIAQLPALIAVLPVIIYMYLTQDATTATLFTVWVGIGSLSDNVLKPMLMGRGVAVPMPIILIGAIGGMMYYGMTGLFLGAVILAIWYELFVFWIKLEKQEATEASISPQQDAISSEKSDT
ncbi:AI-2E family transporter [Photobacterium arenosum]|uniref:AI-2E family transporter n=1 Tax=Photobacterium arenosum TaxID=2774143 RepID=UPI002889D4AE|nr:AI-2E family transporter [Photobacterium arenosum]